jgi:hypothetical protein
MALILAGPGEYALDHAIGLDALCARPLHLPTQRNLLILRAAQGCPMGRASRWRPRSPRRERSAR